MEPQRPGRWISARRLRRMAQDAAARRRLLTRGRISQADIGIPTLADAQPRAFDVALSGASSPYSIQEVYDTPGGGFATLTNGRSCSACAYERNAIGSLGGKYARVMEDEFGAYRFVFSKKHSTVTNPCLGPCGGPFPNTINVTDPAGSFTLSNVNYYWDPAGSCNALSSNPPTQHLLSSPTSTVTQSWVGCHTASVTGRSLLTECSATTSISAPVYYNLMFTGCNNPAGAFFTLRIFVPTHGCQQGVTLCGSTAWFARTCAAFPWSNQFGTATSPFACSGGLYSQQTGCYNAIGQYMNPCSTFALLWTVRTSPTVAGEIKIDTISPGSGNPLWSSGSTITMS